MKQNKQFQIGIGCTIVEGLLSGCNVILLYFVISMLWDGAVDLQKILVTASILAVVFAARFIIYGYGYMQGQLGGAKMSKDIRIRLGEKLKNISLSHFTNRQTGLYINIVTTDVANYEKILTHKTGDIAKNMVLCAMMIAFAFYVWLPAGALLLCATLSLVPAIWLSFRRVKKYGNQKSNISAQAVSSILEYINGIQTLRAYGVCGTKNKKVTEDLKAYSDVSYVYEKRVLPIGTVLGVIIWVCLPAIMWMASHPWAAGELDTVSYILVCLLPFLIGKLTVVLFIDLTSYKNLTISKNQIQSIFAEPESRATAQLPQHTAYDITFEDVYFSYTPKEKVLKGACFTANENQLTAIVGDSGSGKSTIFNLISKYYEPQKGSVKIGGIATHDIAAENVLQQISMVDQDVFLFDDTIRNNIRYARSHATDDEVEEACKLANCDGFICALEQGYDTKIGENGNRLSGGERQRISIARAILKNSPILLLDEVTASLDIENELAVKQAIVNLLKQKRTVIMIAHTLPIIKNANQILVVEDGKISERGTHEELIAEKGKYAAMWKAIG